ncbi:5'-(N(7)-methylguanosine 5'-triphospho)-[mRNA] hydrolase [Ascochyta rabiei]|uniref:Hydrolase n=1 Tax=Didymella rabiei TaxID=5454 RepID=A0A163JV36_DIDRA|nr:5'-(N(7)-methylguanosine 5'-triphospho)-[mRNA] hydrolase [Ascochyta rabiei]KZM26619.1 hydrolase [Ascochyta rabiei]UPX14965.1 5'-(N(7)-methylguanosine 5'-triphospho)-[mRNA] hydrolase [Ascochyta rabiei]
MTMTNTKMTLVDWLDDLCVRFIVNLPQEELLSVERICFQIEEAQWFYEDFIRPLDPHCLPSMHLRKFSQLMFQHCPLFSAYSAELHQQAYDQFLAYKTRVPVRGAIMLNQDMTHAVLVKGWKKGAKWSFPRGKINKEENDLDCAVREVWEETGYDLNQASLVLPEHQMKSITVTMREQSMMLYVFRGVPMDTYFEPRTRKEISKIDWYKLTDLPTVRRKNQAQQHGTGQDLIKENSFYMVAPFLGPLRAWIKLQHKLDKQRARVGQHVAPPPAITDDDDFQPERYDATGNEGTAQPAAQPLDDDNFANLVARLGQAQTPSELAAQSLPSVDPAAELKKLLSVGRGPAAPVEAPGIQPQANPLLALLQGNSGPRGSSGSLPQTPYEQIVHTPMQPPQSPHGQHHPLPPQMGPPPPFPFPPQQNMHFQGSPQHPQDMPLHLPQHFMPPPPPPNQNFQQQQSFGQPPPLQEQITGAHGRPEAPHASGLPTPKLTAHALGLLNSFRISEQKPTPPQAHASSLQQPQYSTPRLQQPHPQYPPHELVSPPHVMSPPTFQSPPLSQPQPKPRTVHQDSLLTLFSATPPAKSPAPAEPAELSAYPLTPGFVQAQPSTGQGNPPNQTLLDLFSTKPKTGLTSATVNGPVNAPDFDTVKRRNRPSINGNSRGPSPATQVPMARVGSEVTVIAASKHAQQAHGDVCAAPAPAFQPQILKRSQQAAPAPGHTAHAQGLLDMFKGPSPQLAAAQPAVIPAPTAQAQGMLNTLKGPSPQPAAARPAQAQGLLDMFKGSPQTKPAQPATTLPASGAPPTAQAQGLLNIFQNPSPQPFAHPAQVRSVASPATLAAQPTSFHRRESVASDQRNALLGLFSKPSPQPTARVPMQQSHSPLPFSRTPNPPTPKTAMSGLVSPVSPMQQGSRTGTPADLASRSRISSIGEPTPGQSEVPVLQGPGFSLVGAKARESDAKSPVDKTFLLGFLEDVARRGR